MSTSLPTNRVKKVKLPNNVEYTIVPEILQSNGYQASLPTLTEDRVILTEGSAKEFSLEPIVNQEVYFGEIVPDDITVSWFAEFYVDIDVPFSAGSSNDMYKDGKIIFTCNGGTLSPSDTGDYAFVNTPTVVCLLKRRPNESNSGSTWTIRPVFRSFRNGYYQDAFDNDYGEPFGFYLRTWNSATFKFRLGNCKNCKIKLYDNYVQGYTNTLAYLYDSDCLVSSVLQFDSLNDMDDLYSNSIAMAKSNVYVNDTYSGPTYYLTGSTSTGYNSLFKNNNVYINGNGKLYAGSSIETTYVSIGNTTYYDSYIVSYSYEDEDNYEIYFPGKSGTIALTSDIKDIPIDDLTDL